MSLRGRKETINEKSQEYREKPERSIQICGPTVGRLRQEDHQLESSLGFIDKASIRKREGQQRKKESARRSGKFHWDRGSKKLHLNINLSRKRNRCPEEKQGLAHTKKSAWLA